MTERELVIMGAAVFESSIISLLPPLDAEYNEVNKVLSLIKTGILEGIVYDPSTAIDYLIAHNTFKDLSGCQDAYSRAAIGNNNLPMITKYIHELNAEKKKGQILSKINSILKTGMPTGEVMREVAELVQSGVDSVSTDDDDGSIVAAIEEYLEWKSGERTGLRIGFPYINDLTDYINYGEIVTYLGRPGTGKTFLMMHTVYECLKSPSTGRIAFFTIEMNRATFIERMMQMYYTEGRYSLDKKQKNGEINLGAFKNQMERLSVFPKSYSVQEMVAILRRRKIKIAFIDYLQIVRQPFGNSIFEQTTFSMRQIKEMAKRDGIAVFLASQISRKGEGGWEPVTIDMARSSGEIEEHSDFMLGIWNPSIAKNADIKRWGAKRKIGLIKNKRGPVGSVEVSMDSNTGVMMEIGQEGANERGING